MDEDDMILQPKKEEGVFFWCWEAKFKRNVVCKKVGHRYISLVSGDVLLKKGEKYATKRMPKLQD